MVPLQELRITAEAFSETPLVRKESQTTCMSLVLVCCGVGVSDDDLLEVSVNEGNMVEELDDLLTSAADEETRTSGPKLDNDYTV